MEVLKIILLSIGSAIFFGIIHDQMTARVCVEYFTIGHPPVFNTDSPTLLAFGWGIIATWWVGLILGVPMASAARLGAYPKMKARALIRPIAILLCCMGCICLVAGISGYLAASAGVVWLLEPMNSLISPERHVVFIADLWSHLAAYGSGFVGGLILCRRIWKCRVRQASAGIQTTQ